MVALNAPDGIKVIETALRERWSSLLEEEKRRYEDKYAQYVADNGRNGQSHAQPHGSDVKASTILAGTGNGDVEMIDGNGVNGA